MQVPNVAAVLHALVGLLLASNAMAAVSFSSTTHTNPTRSWIAATASADFNGDGRPDILVVGQDHILSYFEGVGDGTFGPPIPTDFSALTTDEPWSVVVADFNGDGNLDVAIGYWTATTPGGGNAVFSLHFGDGSGHFSSVLRTGQGSGHVKLAAGDFNGDGYQDLAYAYDFPEAAIWIEFGNGDGTFKSAVAVYTGNLAGAVVAADVDNDGRLDLISGPGTVVLLNAGSGTFIPVINPPGNGGPDVAIGDLNGDGNLDLVSSEWSASGPWISGSYTGCVYVYLGDGHGHFDSHPTSMPCGYSSGVGGGIALADINTDGKLDIVTGGIIGNTLFGFAGVQVFLGDGTGDFTNAYASPISLPWGTFIIDDFNRDGRPDVVATNTPNLNFGPRPGDFTIFSVLINTSPYGCVDSLTLNYSANTLTLGFTIKSAIPTQWSSWIAWQNSIVPLWSVSIPAVPAQVSFSLPIPGVPPIGNIGVLTTMSSSSFGLMCGDLKVVNTGGVGPTAQALSRMLQSTWRAP